MCLHCLCGRRVKGRKGGWMSHLVSSVEKEYALRVGYLGNHSRKWLGGSTLRGRCERATHKMALHFFFAQLGALLVGSLETIAHLFTYCGHTQTHTIFTDTLESRNIFFNQTPSTDIPSQHEWIAVPDWDVRGELWKGRGTESFVRMIQPKEPPSAARHKVSTTLGRPSY